MTGRQNAAGVAAILAAAVLWGTTGTAASLAPALGAAAIGAAAIGLGGLMQALVALPRIWRARRGMLGQWRYLLPGALAVAVYPLAFYGSMRLAGVTIGTVVTIGAAPIFSALVERIAEGRRLSARWSLGAACGIAGIGLICAGHGSGPGTPGDAVTAGIVLGLAGAASYALYSWTARAMMLRGTGAAAAMGATFGAGGLLLLPVLAATGAPFLDSWSNAAVGAYMALVPMFLGYLAYGYGLARVPASTATTLTLLEPVVAAMLAMAVVGERLAATGWAGVALVLSCLVIVTLPRPARRPAVPA
ncbi:DMT family transporter [Mangrovicoccus algicola]|uniref:EamA family transporter n=1 Tax=Mangrovicoccus algicola TaxID=2771008 RepID=A0A8J7CVA5_9RHOB|nr:EamA family transporter [Mangrovicoccus algicola]MBE3638519.1 EamA family transporter [Mangrovicoccus algicola]